MNTISINGITYLVLETVPYQFYGNTRETLILRRPKGKRLYFAVRYENGSLSDVA